MRTNDEQSRESKVQATSPPPEPPEWVRELNGVQALIDRGDYESADAALDASSDAGPRRVVGLHTRARFSA